jgi:hypothetical protein
MTESFIPWLKKHFPLVALALLSIFINIIIGCIIFSNQLDFSSSNSRSSAGDSESVTIELSPNLPVPASPSLKTRSSSSPESALETSFGEHPSLSSDKTADANDQNPEGEQSKSRDGLHEASKSLMPTIDSLNSDRPNKTSELILSDSATEQTGASSLTRSIRRGTRSGSQLPNNGSHEQKASSAKKFFDNLRTLEGMVDQEIICRLVTRQVICADGWVLSTPLADEWIKWSSIGLAPAQWPVSKKNLELTAYISYP